MLFAIIAHDTPGATELRIKTRPSHLAFIEKSGATVKLGGALLSFDGNAMIGSVIVIEADDLAAAEAWSARDPYRTEGVFGEVEIRPYRLAVGTLG